LMMSMRFLGQGNDADKLNVMVEFFKFLGVDLYNLCVNIANYENYFWYIWASDGTNGFLLDLIKRPTELELRMDLYNSGMNPSVNKQYLPLSDFQQALNGTVMMGDVITLSNSSCLGTVNNIPVQVQFSLSGRHMEFIVPWLQEASNGLLPLMSSSYGQIIAAVVGNVTFRNPTPLILTSYLLEYELSWLQWVVISAPQFDNTDLQVEIMGLYVGIWAGTSYVYYAGKTHYLNDPLRFETSFNQTGEVINGNRNFTASIETTSISLNIQCSAPEEQFALLDKEGNTYIYTTVLGSCSATVTYQGKTASFKSKQHALLEVKTPS